MTFLLLCLFFAVLGLDVLVPFCSLDRLDSKTDVNGELFSEQHMKHETLHMINWMTQNKALTQCCDTSVNVVHRDRQWHVACPTYCFICKTKKKPVVTFLLSDNFSGRFGRTWGCCVVSISMEEEEEEEESI